MKKILLTVFTIVATGFIFNAFGQINLDVEGRAIIRDGTPRLDFYNTSLDRAETYMFSSNGNFFLHSRYGDISFRANDNAGFTTRMFIDGTDGHVGIGTSSPFARLHLGDGAEASLTSHGYLMMGSLSSGNMVLDANELQARNNGNAATLHVQPAGGNVYMDNGTLTLNAATNRVGIGTFFPDVKLNVVGGTDVTASGGGYLQLGSTSGLNLGLDDNEIQARSNTTASTLTVQRDGGDLLLCGTENGQVGIGVSSISGLPNDTDYLLAVDGKIIAEELRVELSGAWPDYVFEDDYNLLSIEEFAKSIIENGHLPGIPSAAEVKREGHLIGDIQRKMLEKMEELSLYIIQLEARIKSLEKIKS